MKESVSHTASVYYNPLLLFEKPNTNFRQFSFSDEALRRMGRCVKGFFYQGTYF